MKSSFAARIDNYRSHSATFRMNVALDELPRFTCLQHLGEVEQQKYSKGIVIFAPSAEYWERA